MIKFAGYLLKQIALHYNDTATKQPDDKAKLATIHFELKGLLLSSSASVNVDFKNCLFDACESIFL